MSDHLREAGVIVAHLSRALLDGSRDLRTVPGLVKRIITDHLWERWADPASGREFGPFKTFAEFVESDTAKGGLGSTVRQLRGLCEDDINALDLLDQAAKGRQGERSDLVNIINEVRPQGTSQSQALRRLRSDAPELHADVLAGRLTAHAAMVQAGFRHRTGTVRYDDPESAARSLRKHMPPDTRRALAKLLLDD